MLLSPKVSWLSARTSGEKKAKFCDSIISGTRKKAPNRNARTAVAPSHIVQPMDFINQFLCNGLRFLEMLIIIKNANIKGIEVSARSGSIQTETIMARDAQNSRSLQVFSVRRHNARNAMGRMA